MQVFVLLGKTCGKRVDDYRWNLLSSTDHELKLGFDGRQALCPAGALQ